MSGFGIFPDHAAQYGALLTYRLAAAWLDGFGTVYDWGSGKGFSQQFFQKSPWVGIDGTFAGEANQDLATVRMDCDSILMRHVLEHNVGCWQQILRNALTSFRQRMVLVTFTPFAEETHVFKTEQYNGVYLPYLCFRKAELTDLMGGLLIADEPAPTTHPEHIFYLAK